MLEKQKSRAQEPADDTNCKQLKTKKRKNRAKFPKQEAIGHGPSGPLYSSSAPASTLLQLPEYNVGGSIPLTLDFDMEDVPPVHIRLDTDKRSRHARRKHAQAHRWNSTVIPSLIHPFMEFKRLRGLAAAASTEHHFCTCPHVRTLRVLCVHMEC
jgi:hypothetical protein